MTVGLQSNEAEPEATVNTLINGDVDIDVSGAVDVVLSDGQAQHAYINLTGAITADINVIVPAEKKGWWIDNQTTGAFSLTIKTSAGAGVALTQGKKAHFHCNGSTVKRWSAED